MRSLARARREDGCLSDYVLDQLLAGDLDEVSGEPSARAHVAECQRCQSRFRRFEAVEVPPPFMVQATTSGLLPSTKTTATRIRLTPTIAMQAALAASAIAAVGNLVLTDFAKPDGENGTRFKGSIALSVFTQRANGEVARLAPGDVVFPDDSLRFELATARGAFAAVVGIDSRGMVTPYAPFAGSMLRLEGGPPVALPGAIIADGTLGPERILAVSCPSERALSDVVAAARGALARAGGDPRNVQTLGLACDEATFDIYKNARP